jgi:hypothetical protein
MGMWQNVNLILKLVAIQIPVSVDVGKVMVAFIENLLCNAPVVLIHKYSLKWQLLYGTVLRLICSGIKLRLDLDEPNLA